MKERNNRIAWSRIVLILLLALIMLFGSACKSFGAYTNSQRAQRTIAAYDSGGDRFSSNYLNPGNSRDNVRTVFVADSSIRPSAVVTVCNYQQGKQTRPNDQDIEYTLTVRLVKYDAEEETKYVAVDAGYLTANSLTGYSVDVKKGSEEPVTLGSSLVQKVYSSCTLTGGASDSDVFSLTFSDNFAENQPNLYVEMIAVPTDGSLPTIRGIFRTGIRVEGASNAWTGSFTDDDANDPDEYDGLNYTVTGIGSGTFTLKWDGALLELSWESVKELLEIDGATKVENCITFPVDSDTVARYDLQFYKAGDISAKSWSDMNSVLGAAGDALATGKVVGYYFAGD